MNVLITGATGGIGQELVKKVIKENNFVIALGRNSNSLNALAAEYKDKIITKQADLTNKKELDDMLKWLETENIEVDMLINNAGSGLLDRYEDTDIIDEMSMIDLDVSSVAYLTHYFYKIFQKKGKGGLINVSSIAGCQTGGPYMVGYYAAKAYVKSLTMGLIAENDNKEIKIMVLCPGPTYTDFVGMKVKGGLLADIYMTSPEYVATKGYNDFMKGKKISLPGYINKIIFYIEKIVPYSFEMFVIKNFQKKKMKNIKK